MSYRHGGGPHNYADPFLVCRGVAHSWVHPQGHWSIARRNTRIIEFRRTLVCATCGSERTDIFDAQMRPVRTLRRYPTGYLTTGEERIDGPAARLEQIRRLGLG